MVIKIKNPKKIHYSYIVNGKLKVHKIEKSNDWYGKFNERIVFDNKTIKISGNESEKSIQDNVDTAINSFNNFKINIEV